MLGNMGVKRALYLCQKLCIFAKETYIYAKETYIFAKETYIYAKEPCFSSDGHMSSAGGCRRV